ncbi:hypothetical protein BJ944DRAFT_251226 [Cunninghamella echinulata]|nr:hypothetical protein BJ944DRAFT_251226 [Cunninghamella echinulata]
MDETLTAYYSVSLWYLQGCTATFYVQSQPNEKRKPIQTISFTKKASFAYKQLNSFIISAPTSYFIHLTSILLQNNHLTNLPIELWQLENLKEINLGHNQLTEISERIGQLKHLQQLYLYNNQLKRLPYQLGLLKELNELDITANQLTYLPYGLPYGSLKQLWLDDNLFHDQLSFNNNTSIIPPLRDLCFQRVAPHLQKEQMHYLPFSIIEQYNSSHHPFTLYNHCEQCDTLLYFNGIPLIQHQIIKNQSIPIVHLVCSQQCRSLWLKKYQNNNNNNN